MAKDKHQRGPSWEAETAEPNPFRYDREPYDPKDLSQPKRPPTYDDKGNPGVSRGPNMFGQNGQSNRGVGMAWPTGGGDYDYGDNERQPRRMPKSISGKY